MNMLIMKQGHHLRPKKVGKKLQFVSKCTPNKITNIIPKYD